MPAANSTPCNNSSNSKQAAPTSWGKAGSCQHPHPLPSVPSTTAAVVLAVALASADDTLAPKQWHPSRPCASVVRYCSPLLLPSLSWLGCGGGLVAEAALLSRAALRAPHHRRAAQALSAAHEHIYNTLQYILI